jgi:hypothetical protein
MTLYLCRDANESQSRVPGVVIPEEVCIWLAVNYGNDAVDSAKTMNWRGNKGDEELIQVVRSKGQPLLVCNLAGRDLLILRR